jgi:hypothetical protein
MAIGTAGPRTATIPTDLPKARRTFRPVRFWAGIGIVHFVVAAYILIRWLTSGDLHATDTGADKAPDHVLAAVSIGQILSPLIGAGIVWWWLIRPWIRERRLTTEGMALIAALCLYFPYDITNNYTTFFFQYNAHFWNVGSWLGAMPGAMVPRSHNVVEPIIFMFPAYAWGVFLPMLWGAKFMAWLRKRRPGIGNAGLLGITLLLCCFFDLVGEGTVVLLQIESYYGAQHHLSIFGGTIHQFPVYETLFIGLLYVGGSALLFFRDDKGRTFVEKGGETTEPALGGRAKGVRTGTRQLAVIGFFVTLEFACFMVPINWMALHVDTFPAGGKSYLIEDVCGPGTPYPCPVKGAALPRRGGHPDD